MLNTEVLGVLVAGIVVQVLAGVYDYWALGPCGLHLRSPSTQDTGLRPTVLGLGLNMSKSLNSKYSP